MGVDHRVRVQGCGCTIYEDWDDSGSGFSSGLIRRWEEHCAYHGGHLPCSLEGLTADAIIKDIKAAEETIAQLQKQLVSKKAYLNHVQSKVKR